MSISFTDKSFVITGTFKEFERKEIEEIITSKGGVIKSSVSSKTDYLICGEKAGSKLAKAEELGITIISEEEFKNSLNNGENQMSEKYTLISKVNFKSNYTKIEKNGKTIFVDKEGNEVIPYLFHIYSGYYSAFLLATSKEGMRIFIEKCGDKDILSEYCGEYFVGSWDELDWLYLRDIFEGEVELILREKDIKYHFDAGDIVYENGLEINISNYEYGIGNKIDLDLDLDLSHLDVVPDRFISHNDKEPHKKAEQYDYTFLKQSSNKGGGVFGVLVLPTSFNISDIDTNFTVCDYMVIESKNLHIDMQEQELGDFFEYGRCVAEDDYFYRNGKSLNQYHDNFSSFAKNEFGIEFDEEDED